MQTLFIGRKGELHERNMKSVMFKGYEDTRFGHGIRCRSTMLFAAIMVVSRSLGKKDIQMIKIAG